MDVGHFYYIDDQYYDDFQDDNLMKNKETTNGQPHGRPFFFAFLDETTGLYWMIPISSKVPKYRALYVRKIQKYHQCDTIAFGYVLGHEKAFLIQNMCPITPDYIKNEYVDSVKKRPVTVAGNFEANLIKKAKDVLRRQRTLTKQGREFRLILPDVFKIEQILLNK